MKSALRIALALLAMVLVLVVGRATARAGNPVCDTKTCSVTRNCSNTGVLCDPDDRACNSRASQSGLEVKCEQECDVGKRFVYCPPDTGRSDDSGYVWILLVLASVLAVGGMTVAWLALRKKA